MASVGRAARHQSAFREVNENIAKLAAPAAGTGYFLFICECGDTSCAESLELTTAEYEAVRSAEGRFVVVPGHQQEASERVVARNGRFLVVEKIGDAGESAELDDPRGS